MSEKNKLGPVVGWHDGKFLVALPGGRLADASGNVIDDSTGEKGTIADDDQAEPDIYKKIN